MYYIVEFLEEKTVAVVPSSWMSSLDSCRWPPTTPEWEKKITKLVKLKSQPEETFLTYKVRVLGTSETLERAHFKSRKARETSDINTTDAEEKGSRPKRKIFKRKLYSSSEEDGSLHEDEMGNYIPAPQPPALFSCSPVQQSSSVVSPVSPVPGPSQHQSSGLTPRSVPHCSSYGSPFGRPTALENTDTTGMGVEALLRLNAEFHKQLLRKLKFIEAEQMKLKDFLVNIPNGSSHTHHRLPSLPFGLPMMSEDELIIVEEFLKTETNQDTMIRHLKLVGGSQLDTAVRGILSRSMTNGLASNYSYNGLRNKKSFKSLKLQEVIFGATQALYPEVTESEFSKIVGDWLRYVPRKKGGSKQREERSLLRKDPIDMDDQDEL